MGKSYTYRADFVSLFWLWVCETYLRREQGESGSPEGELAARLSTDIESCNVDEEVK